MAAIGDRVRYRVDYSCTPRQYGRTSARIAHELSSLPVKGVEIRELFNNTHLLDLKADPDHRGVTRVSDVTKSIERVPCVTVCNVWQGDDVDRMDIPMRCNIELSVIAKRCGTCGMKNINDCQGCGKEISDACPHCKEYCSSKCRYGSEGPPVAFSHDGSVVMKVASSRCANESGLSFMIPGIGVVSAEQLL